MPWLQVFGNGDLFTFAFREAGRLVALAPMFLQPLNGRRQVTFLGSGASDYLDFLTGAATENTGLAALFACLAQHRQRWDLCDLQDLHKRSPLCNIEVPPELHGVIQPHCVCSAISLPDTPKQFEEELPHGLRRNLRRSEDLARRRESDD